MRKFYLIWSVFVCISSSINAQVGIGTSIVQNGILLQVESTNKGILLPNVALTSTSLFTPITGTPTTGLMVYNTNTAGSGTIAVSPGFYYWDNSVPSWIKIQQKNAAETALFSNQNTVTNINSGSGVLPICLLM